MYGIRFIYRLEKIVRLWECLAGRDLQEQQMQGS
jgi:hypothetical protein